MSVQSVVSNADAKHELDIERNLKRPFSPKKIVQSISRNNFILSKAESPVSSFLSVIYLCVIFSMLSLTYKFEFKSTLIISL